MKPKLLIFRAQYKSQDKLLMTRIHLGSNDSLVSYEMVKNLYLEWSPHNRPYRASHVSSNDFLKSYMTMR